MNQTTTSLLAAGAVILSLSACAGEPTEKAAPEPAPTTEATTTAPTTSAAEPTAQETGDVTAPGSRLKIGDRAVVPFSSGTDKEGTIAISVTAIEAGTAADLAAFGDKAKGMTPYFIRVEVENVGGTDLSYSSVRLRGLGPDGKSTGVIISGDVDKCESESAGREFTTAGAKYETCVLQAAREGDEVTAASFDKGDDYLKSPIVWSK